MLAHAVRASIRCESQSPRASGTSVSDQERRRAGAARRGITRGGLQSQERFVLIDDRSAVRSRRPPRNEQTQALLDLLADYVQKLDKENDSEPYVPQDASQAKDKPQTTVMAGAGLIPKPATGPAAQGTLAGRPSVVAIAHRIEEWWPLGREVGWLRELGGGAA
jgi:hypothetical protein